MNQPEDRMDKLLDAALGGSDPDQRFSNSLRRRLAGEFQPQTGVCEKFWPPALHFAGTAAMIVLMWIGLRSLQVSAHRSCSQR